ncbi:NADH dehydrogenase I subunit K [Sulfobacillus acidophilus TPY]|uniref:NADH-quinone oxidoreductase subunit K n=1 Tax=Sulfobacillus acidophilus (strain ATCC 700253 / DSM 10332 / NAL) TaxID=679936 RepID=G8TYH8_SULAD|nr:NADH dehydrogenase I subunit K [Sulfobacillus acidophilus TPY]AEW06239.1 NADH dehydrogenase subunit K [Sulfobacillus acidophilus DSM 10332]MCY0863716.1 NADH-quinone oxidoreductase subunit NuoK [Sulfobacillus sp.]
MPLNWVVGLGAALFVIGAVGVLIRKNPLIIFMASEMMWNAAALVFIAYARAFHVMNGQVMAFLIIGTAAAEVGIGLAIIVTVYHHRHRLDIDEIAQLKG